MKNLITRIWQRSLICVLCFSLVACTVDEVLSSIDAGLEVAQGLSGAVGAVNPGDAASLTLLTGLGMDGIQAIQKAYDTYEKNKTTSNAQNVVIAAEAIQSNLPQELAALHISDPNAVAKANAWVNLLTDCAAAVVSEMQALSPGLTVKKSRATNFVLTPEYIQHRWLTDVCQGDTACGNLVKVHHKHHFKLF